MKPQKPDAAVQPARVTVRLDDAAIEVVRPEAMFGRIVAMVQGAASGELREDLGRYAAGVQGKLGKLGTLDVGLQAALAALDIDVGRDITAGFNVLLASAFLAGTRSPAAEEAAEQVLQAAHDARTAAMREAKKAKRKPLWQREEAAHRCAEEKIEARGVPATRGRICAEMRKGEFPEMTEARIKKIRKRIRDKGGGLINRPVLE